MNKGHALGDVTNASKLIFNGEDAGYTYLAPGVFGKRLPHHCALSSGFLRYVYR
jgi:hypothetical protein